MVDVRFVRRFRREVTLEEIKVTPALSGMELSGSRLSIQPVQRASGDHLHLGGVIKESEKNGFGGEFEDSSVRLHLFASGVPVSAAPESLVIYLDGALVEKEAVARKGYVEFPLPDKILPDTLRIKPVGNCSVLRVQVENVETAKRHARELAVMMERKAHLTDRLKELEDREGIFRAAVKSHSSRALRKTKNNPEPLDTARKGTAFAVAQLESVHAARRKTERELASVEGKIASLEKNTSTGKSARVWLSRQTDESGIPASFRDCLTPWYDFAFRARGARKRSCAPSPPVARSTAVSWSPDAGRRI